MKTICSVFLAFLFAVCASAQTLPAVKTSAASGVSVIEKNWRIARQPRFVGTTSTSTLTAEDWVWQKRQSDINARKGLPPAPPPTPRKTTATVTTLGEVIYLYEVKFRNDGAKAIRQIVWDYVVYEAGTGNELGRRNFKSNVKISPRKGKSVSGRSSLPPSNIVVVNADDDAVIQYSEEIEIKSIEYADGTTWEAAP